MSQEVYDKAKEQGNVSGREEFLKLAVQVKNEDGTSGGIKSTGVHKVKFVSDEKINFTPYKKTTKVDGIKYTFEENKVNKIMIKELLNSDGKLNYFIEKMREFEYGEELSLEYVKKGITGFVNINKEGESSEPKEEIIDINDIPVIEE